MQVLRSDEQELEPPGGREVLEGELDVSPLRLQLALAILLRLRPLRTAVLARRRRHAAAAARLLLLVAMVTGGDDEAVGGSGGGRGVTLVGVVQGRHQGGHRDAAGGAVPEVRVLAPQRRRHLHLSQRGPPPIVALRAAEGLPQREVIVLVGEDGRAAARGARGRQAAVFRNRAGGARGIVGEEALVRAEGPAHEAPVVLVLRVRLELVVQLLFPPVLRALLQGAAQVVLGLEVGGLGGGAGLRINLLPCGLRASWLVGLQVGQRPRAEISQKPVRVSAWRHGSGAHPDGGLVLGHRQTGQRVPGRDSGARAGRARHAHPAGVTPQVVAGADAGVPRRLGGSWDDELRYGLGRDHVGAVLGVAAGRRPQRLLEPREPALSHQPVLQLLHGIHGRQRERNRQLAARQRQSSVVGEMERAVSSW